MWQMKEWLVKFVVQSIWRRRKELYYAVSVVSIAGNLVVLVGPSVQSSLVLRGTAWSALPFQAAWSALLQLVEVVLHRSVLYVLLNLIVVRMVVKSGVLSQTQGMPAAAAKAEESCLASSLSVVRGLPSPAYNNYTVCGAQSTPAVPVFADPSMSLQQAHCEDKKGAAVDTCAQTSGRRQRPSAKKSCDGGEQRKRAPATKSIFTIEPLVELVQSKEGDTHNNNEAHIGKTPNKHRLRKVASRHANLHVDPTEAKMVVKAEHHARNDEQSLELVLAKKDGDDDEKGNAEVEHEDNRLSRQEFNERVDTFISKFKRSLTMQRQDSFNRLLGLVGGGGDIRVIK